MAKVLSAIQLHLSEHFRAACNVMSESDSLTAALQLHELKAIDRIALQNSVAVSILLKSMQEDAKLQHIKISWDFSHHSCYPSIAVKHVAATQ